jgi:hypothetical protein
MSAPQPPKAGLCARCTHARLVRTPRSAFWLCGRAQDDARFERYPRLPVLRCHGFTAFPDNVLPGDDVPPGRSSGRDPQE